MLICVLLITNHLSGIHECVRVNINQMGSSPYSFTTYAASSSRTGQFATEGLTVGPHRTVTLTINTNVVKDLLGVERISILPFSLNRDWRSAWLIAH